MTPTTKLQSAAALFAAAVAGPALATLPTPPQGAALRQATPYLYYAGAGDVFEITSSMIAIPKSRNPEVRAFASKLVEHHTMTTNGRLRAPRQLASRRRRPNSARCKK